MGIVEKPICAVNLLWVNGFINNVLLSHKEAEKQHRLHYFLDI